MRGLLLKLTYRKYLVTFNSLSLEIFWGANILNFKRIISIVIMVFISVTVYLIVPRKLMGKESVSQKTSLGFIYGIRSYMEAEKMDSTQFHNY